MWRCAHDGHVRTVLSEKKFGTANRHTTSAVIKILAAFHRVKNNIDTLVLVTIRPGVQIPKFASVGGTLAHELRNQKGTLANSQSWCGFRI